MSCVLGRAQQGQKRANQVQPPERESEQAVERPHQLQLLLEPAGLVEPREEVEQGVDLPGEVVELEQVAGGCCADEPVRLLDPARYCVRALLELLDRGDRGRRLVSRLIQRRREGTSVLALRLRLEPRERARAGNLERVGPDPDGAVCRSTGKLTLDRK